MGRLRPAELPGHLGWHELKKVATFSQEDGMWAEVDPPETLDLSSLNYDTMFFWSHALGGNVRVKLDCTEDGGGEGPMTFDCSADDTATVVFYAESVVYPGDTVPATFACMNQCPNGANSETGDIYFDDSALGFQDVAPADATYISYAFNQDTMLLMYGATPIVQTVENTTNQWGSGAGPCSSRPRPIWNSSAATGMSRTAPPAGGRPGTSSMSTIPGRADRRTGTGSPR